MEEKEKFKLCARREELFGTCIKCGNGNRILIPYSRGEKTGRCSSCRQGEEEEKAREKLEKKQTGMCPVCGHEARLSHRGREEDERVCKDCGKRERGRRRGEKTTWIVSQSIPIPSIQSSKSSSCAHYWIIDEANGTTSKAACKLCGEIGEFSNYSGGWTIKQKFSYKNSPSKQEPEPNRFKLGPLRY